jgi:hypothetical protein
MPLTRDQILEAKDLKTVKVKVPEWANGSADCEVIISMMTGTARDAWEQALLNENREVRKENHRSRLLVFCMVDEAGNRIFSDEDVEALGRKSAPALERCVQAARILNLLSEAELEETKGN